MPKIKRPRTSRRAPALKDSDYDHEISLVDHGDPSEGAFRAGYDGGNDDGDHTDSDGASESGSDDEGEAAAVSNVASNSQRGENTANANANNISNDEHSDRDDDNSSDDNDNDTSLGPLIITTSYDHADHPDTTDAVRNVPTGATTSSSAALLPSASRTTATAGERRGRQSLDRDRLSKGPTVVQSERLGPDLTPYISAPNPILGLPSTRQGRPSQEGRTSQDGCSSFQSARRAPEFGIDILYENQRGGFLCGVPMFSGRALGNLDPPPWTNYAHNPSPTDLTTAQVPDPSWEWAWPEWRINHDNDCDKDGWEYSFMFAKCFSWHGPNWYGSFVRRRAWIRKRVKRQAAVTIAGSSLREVDSSRDPNLLNPEYFTVLPAASLRRAASHASSRGPSRATSRAGSRRGSASATSQTSGAGVCGMAAGSTAGDENAVVGYDDDGKPTIPEEISDTDVLMRVLRAAIIDREKIGAVDNFLEHAGEDLVRLQDVMHEIMALLVFQTSRQTLLTHLKNAYNAASEQQRKTRGKPGGHGEEEIKENGKADNKDDVAKASNEGGMANGGLAPVEEKGKSKAAAEPVVQADAANATNVTNTAKKAAEDSPDDQVRIQQALGRRVGYLAAAVHHADEEVRRLEYWSDVKAVAKTGGESV